MRIGVEGKTGCGMNVRHKNVSSLFFCTEVRYRIVLTLSVLVAIHHAEDLVHSLLRQRMQSKWSMSVMCFQRPIATLLSNYAVCLYVEQPL